MGQNLTLLLISLFACATFINGSQSVLVFKLYCLFYVWKLSKSQIIWIHCAMGARHNGHVGSGPVNVLMHSFLQSKQNLPCPQGTITAFF